MPTPPVQPAREDPRRRLPAVDRLLQDRRVVQLIDLHGRRRITDTLRALLDEHRRQPADDTNTTTDATTTTDRLMTTLQQRLGPPPAQLLPVFNLTGTVLHTNLGRAPLAATAIQAAASLGGPCSLEFDLDQGRRGERDALCERLLCDLTGAEAACIVNNNAAAVLLALNTLALGREVPVSRGELVEIGGSFRIPEIMTRAGCTLVEVGTTNRTHLRDFAAALTPDTGALMQVHTSNYRIEGFTAAVDTAQLAGLARKHAIPLLHDLGSGTLVDLSRQGLPKEPTVREALQAGADLVTFSGDKLLGGPQSGIIAGRADLVAAARSNPLKRALRVDKLVLAALHETLRLYQHPDHLPQTLPTLRLLGRSADAIAATAAALQPAVAALLRGIARVQIRPCASQIGSGALPAATLPSHALTLQALEKPHQKNLEHLHAALRRLPRPVVGRIAHDLLWLDLRCLEDHDQADFLEQLEHLPGLLDRQSAQ